MNKKKTIIYYSSNIENPIFEQKIIDGINKVKGDLPVISVTQKPMDFGKNICVGDKIGRSYVNAYRQCLIGAEAATTPFVVMTESDFLYPPTGYFDYDPIDPNVIYTYDNLWVLFNKPNWNSFFRRSQTHGSLIYGREFLIDFLKNFALKDRPMWANGKTNGAVYLPNWYIYPPPPDSKFKFVEFHKEDPIIQIMTGANERIGCHTLPGKVKEFPYFGSGEEVKKRMLE